MEENNDKVVTEDSLGPESASIYAVAPLRSIQTESDLSGDLDLYNAVFRAFNEPLFIYTIGTGDYSYPCIDIIEPFTLRALRLNDRFAVVLSEIDNPDLAGSEVEIFSTAKLITEAETDVVNQIVDIAKMIALTDRALYTDRGTILQDFVRNHFGLIKGD